MSKFSKIEVFETVARTGMVPVFYHSDAETACRVLKACYDGGVRAFEFTNRGDFAADVFAVLRKFAIAECPEMALGAGSVIDEATAAVYIGCGADFIVGPCFDGQVARICNGRLIPYIPGCGTVSEIHAAHEAGCDITKIFPAGCIGGPEFVKNIKAPMPWTNIMATGAVEPTEENLSKWFEAGVLCVGMGSKLFPDADICAANWNAISDKCRRALEIIASYK